MPHCNHGLDPQSCAHCQASLEIAPLPATALQAAGIGPVIILRTLEDSPQIKIFRLGDGAIVTLPTTASFTPSPIDISDPSRPELIEQARKLALEKGQLFVPDHPLTQREQGPEGHPYCHHCRKSLALTLGSLGCTQCNKYTCLCGHCLCGYTGRNYLGQVFHQHPPLSIPREDRVEYVRVVRFCTGAA